MLFSLSVCSLPSPALAHNHMHRSFHFLTVVTHIGIDLTVLKMKLFSHFTETFSFSNLDPTDCFSMVGMIQKCVKSLKQHTTHSISGKNNPKNIFTQYVKPLYILRHYTNDTWFVLVTADHIAFLFLMNNL